MEDVLVENLEKLVKEYPFFSVGQLLLAKKLKMNNNSRHQAQMEKAALYISNPYWLHYQLLNRAPSRLEFISTTQGSSTAEVQHTNENKTISSSDTHHEEWSKYAPPVVLVDEAQNKEPENESVLEQAENNLHVDANEEATNADQLTDIPITSVYTQEEIEAASELAHVQLAETGELPIPPDFTTTDPVEATDVSIVVNQANSEDVFYSNTKQVNSNRFAVTEVEPVHEEIPTEQNLQPNKQQYIDEFQPTIITNEAQPVAQQTQAEAEMAAISRDTDPIAEAFIEQLPTTTEHANLSASEQEETAPDEHEQMFQNIKAMLDATTEESEKGVEGAVIPIDPYHTIDYFASQGIKLDFDPNPQDKLGKQVKKFTQWLRHMKKLGPEDAIDQLQDEQAESDVQQIADSSNTAKEVVTEAMAQVLEKQGKTEKAIQLYTKLSFLNPHKSAYFADKINHLKDS